VSVYQRVGVPIEIGSDNCTGLLAGSTGSIMGEIAAYGRIREFVIWLRGGLLCNESLECANQALKLF
jgi:hypothetical protein